MYDPNQQKEDIMFEVVISDNKTNKTKMFNYMFEASEFVAYEYFKKLLETVPEDIAFKETISRLNRLYFKFMHEDRDEKYLFASYLGVDFYINAC